MIIYFGLIKGWLSLLVNNPVKRLLQQVDAELKSLRVVDSLVLKKDVEVLQVFQSILSIELLVLVQGVGTFQISLQVNLHVAHWRGVEQLWKQLLSVEVRKAPEEQVEAVALQLRGLHLTVKLLRHIYVSVVH